MAKFPRNHRAKTKPLPTPKKKREEKAWVIPEEDMPHAGDIWRVRIFQGGGWRDYHYLLLEPHIDAGWDWSGFSWLTLCLEDGFEVAFHMNFGLDDWAKVA